MKARRASEAKRLEDIPNVGIRMAEDFRRLGIVSPGGLKGRDAYALYKKMCATSGVRQDPCALDTYMAAIDFMNGSVPRPWYAYTPLRKKLFPDL